MAASPLDASTGAVTRQKSSVMFDDHVFCRDASSPGGPTAEPSPIAPATRGGIGFRRRSSAVAFHPSVDDLTAAAPGSRRTSLAPAGSVASSRRSSAASTLGGSGEDGGSVVHVMQTEHSLLFNTLRRRQSSASLMQESSLADSGSAAAGSDSAVARVATPDDANDAGDAGKGERKEDAPVPEPSVLECLFEHRFGGAADTGSDGGATLAWRRLSYLVPGAESAAATILDKVSGVARPGRVLAVAGPSGSGKTTLLHALAGRLEAGGGTRASAPRLYGTRLVNGCVDLDSAAHAGASLASAIISLVPQNDACTAHETPREALTFASRLRLSRATSAAADAAGAGREGADDECHARLVDEVLALLGLERCADTLMGDPTAAPTAAAPAAAATTQAEEDLGCAGRLRRALGALASPAGRGVSGGERKRVSIGIEIVANTEILLLDEPTTGLDAATAARLGELLRCLARALRKVIVCTVHSPSSTLLATFDDLLLLAPGGRVAYHGPAGEVAHHFFAEAGLPVGPHANVAEHAIECLADAGATATLVGAWAAAETAVDALAAEREAGRVDPDTTARRLAHLVAVAESIEQQRPHAGAQFLLLVRRSATALWRDRSAGWGRLIQAAAFAVILGLFYWQISDGSDGVATASGALFFCVILQILVSALTGVVSFQQERTQFLREQAAGVCAPLLYAAAKVAVEVTFNLLFPLLFASIAYWMVGFRTRRDRLGSAPDGDAFRFDYFATFAGILLMTATTGYLFGFMSSTLFTRLDASLAFIPLVHLPLMMVMGLFANTARVEHSDILYTLEWLAYLSFPRFGFSALVVNEYRGRAVCGPPPQVCAYASGDDYLAFLGFDDHTVGKSAWLLGAAIGLFGSVAFLLLHRAGMQQRSRSVFLAPEQGQGQGQEEGEKGPAAAVTATAAVAVPEEAAATEEKEMEDRGEVAEAEADGECGPWAAGLSWADLVRTAPRTDGGEGERIILGGSVSGSAGRGRVLAILGGSGGGKTTFLDSLAGGGGSSGAVAVPAGSLVALVPQEDLLFPTDTPATALRFAARTRRNLTGEAADAATGQWLEALGLTAVAATRIGDPLNDPASKALSGGERKRVSIGAELIAVCGAAGPVLLLDECTSGLDSAASLGICRLLRRIARKEGATVVLSVHQPTAAVAATFDDVMLLRQGAVAFHGPFARALAYFAAVGYDCPPHFTPTDFFMFLLDDDAEGPRLVRLWARYARLHRGAASHEPAEAGSPGDDDDGVDDEALRAALGPEAPEAHLASAPRPSEQPPEAGAEDAAAVSRAPRFLVRFAELSKRHCRFVYTDARYVLTTVGYQCAFALITGIVYFRLLRDATGLQDRAGLFFMTINNKSLSLGIMAQGRFHKSERALYCREQQANRRAGTGHASGTYSPLNYWLARLLAELPLRIAAMAADTLIIYFMTDLSRGGAGAGAGGEYFHYFPGDPHFADADRNWWNYFYYFLPGGGANNGGSTGGAYHVFTYFFVVLAVAHTASTLGQAVATFFRNNVVGVLIVLLALVPCQLVGGLTATNSQIRPYWYWLEKLSFTRHGYLLLMHNEVGGLMGEFTGWRAGRPLSPGERFFSCDVGAFGAAVCSQKPAFPHQALTRGTGFVNGGGDFGTNDNYQDSAVVMWASLAVMCCIAHALHIAALYHVN